MVETVYGTKYAATKDLRRVEIAALVRADIKAAIKAGELPAGKYSVTCKSFSGGGSISIRISDLSIVALHNPERLRHDAENPHSSLSDRALCRHSDEARGVLAKVEDILQAYNYDGSDIQSDYFHVRFYGHAEFGWEWEAARRTEELADLRHEAQNDVERAELRALEAAGEFPFAPPPNSQLAYLDAIGVAS